MAQRAAEAEERRAAYEARREARQAQKAANKMELIERTEARAWERILRDRAAAEAERAAVDRRMAEHESRVTGAAREWAQAKASAGAARAAEEHVQQQRKQKADEARAKWNPEHAALLREQAKATALANELAAREALAEKQAAATASRARQAGELNDRLSRQSAELEAATKHHVLQRAQRAEADAAHFEQIAKQDEEEHAARVVQIKARRAAEQAERKAKAEVAMQRARDRAVQVAEEAEAATLLAKAKGEAAEAKALAQAAAKKRENAQRARERQQKEDERALAAERRKREHEEEEERRCAEIVAGGRGGSHEQAKVAEQRQLAAERGRVADERQRQEQRAAEGRVEAVQARHEAARQAAYEVQEEHRQRQQQQQQQQQQRRPNTAGGLFVAQRPDVPPASLPRAPLRALAARGLPPPLPTPPLPAAAAALPLTRLADEHADAASFAPAFAAVAAGGGGRVLKSSGALLSFAPSTPVLLPETQAPPLHPVGSGQSSAAKVQRSRVVPQPPESKATPTQVQAPPTPTLEQQAVQREGRLASLAKQAEQAALDVMTVSASDLAELLKRDPALLTGGMRL